MTNTQSVGEFLQKKLDDLDIKQEPAAEALKTSRLTVNQLVNNKRAVTPDMALRLSQWLGKTPEFWLNMQMRQDLEAARAKIGEWVKKNIKPVDGKQRG